MRRRPAPVRLAALAVATLLALSACTAASAPQWSFGAAVAPSSGGAASSAPQGTPAAPASAPASSAASQPVSSSAPSPVASAAASEVASPTVQASPSSSAPEATPRPPDPGQPGFVTGTLAKPRVIDIATTDLLLYSPTVVTVAQGETIAFRVHNTGLAEHEFKVGPMADVFQDLESAPEIPSIKSGETKSLTYTFSANGPYAFGCHAPGHFENGMYGFVNVIPTKPWRGTPDHPRMIVISMDDHLEFVPAEVAVSPGETVLFVLPNVGNAVTHEFQVGPADRVALDQVDGAIVMEADQIQPQHVAYMLYTFGSSGSYAFACHEPGHYEAGMKGIIDMSS